LFLQKNLTDGRGLNSCLAATFGMLYTR
jgi:hypothetical protein